MNIILRSLGLKTVIKNFAMKCLGSRKASQGEDDWHRILLALRNLARGNLAKTSLVMKILT